MPTYHIWTIGCQMNKAESERLDALFMQKGWQATANAADADIIVLNTCVVRKHAEDRVINKLHSLKAVKSAHRNLTLAVTGCWVDSNAARLKKEFPHIDHLFKAGECPPWEDPDNWRQTLPIAPRVTAYVPIIQGCNNFCSYCIVPYRRGRETSRPMAEIVCEVTELAKRGTREVTLLGQNVDSYGHDLPDRPDLADLLTELNPIDGLWRIRFLTTHPKDMSPRLIDAMARLEKVCRAINLPAQSGSDGVLKAMRRGYTVAEYRNLIARIRERLPDVAISNDIIAGFPGETEGQFQETVSLLSDLRFDAVHIAAYSPRPGTIAAREFADDVPAAEKKRRLQVLESLQEGIAGEINAGLQGKDVEVLVEGRQKGKWYGRTRTDKLVFFNSDENWLAKNVIVNIRRTTPWSLQGALRQ